jgi:hypothetical protein
MQGARSSGQPDGAPCAVQAANPSVTARSALASPLPPGSEWRSMETK